MNWKQSNNVGELMSVKEALEVAKNVGKILNNITIKYRINQIHLVNRHYKTRHQFRLALRP